MGRIEEALRRRWGKYLVKMTRQTGDGEIIEITFAERDGDTMRARLDAALDHLHGRMEKSNQKVLQLSDALSKQRTRQESNR